VETEIPQGDDSSYSEAKRRAWQRQMDEGSLDSLRDLLKLWRARSERALTARGRSGYHVGEYHPLRG
jgi:hypothetical protein